MSIQKKTIFPDSKFGIQSLTPSYSKIKCQPLTNTSQQTTAYFLKQNLSQNSNFLKNFKSKHLSSAAPSMSSFVETNNEPPIHPFKVFESQDIEISDRQISKMAIHSETLKNEEVLGNNNTSAFSFDLIENSEEPLSHKTVHKLNAPLNFCASLSPSKGKKQNFPLNAKKNESSKEDKENKTSNQKMKLNFRKRSENMENIKLEKEEFSASKNLLHSSRMNKSKKLDENDPSTIEDKGLVMRNLELELATEKIKVAEYRHTNDELVFEIKSLHNEIERLQTLMNEKDSHFNELINVKEQYKRKLEGNVEYSDYLKSVNLKLIDQINNLLKTKMLGKTT